MAAYLGDFIEDDAVHFLWSSNSATGASITRATNGTVQVYKDNSDAQSTAGVTDTEDFDSLTGVHACTIDLSSDAFYATGANYTVVLAGATIDGQTVNAVLAHFSIQNRYSQPATTVNANVTQISGDATAADNCELFFDGNGYNASTSAIGTVAVATALTTNNDKTGYRLSATGVDDILDEPITEPVGIFTWSGTLRSIIGWMGAVSRNKITQTSTTQTVRNDADNATIAASTISDNGTTFTRGEFS